MERTQRLNEEFANSITHLFGILFSIVAIALLVVFSVLNGSPLDVASCSIFGGTILLMYTFSTLYHAFPPGPVKSLLRTFDHISIYFLIAGTYTPFLLIGLGGTAGWIYLAIVWGLTLIGLVFKLFYTHRFAKLSLALYLSMGWLAIFFIRPLLAQLSLPTLLLIAAGGLAYTVGVFFYTNKKMRYAHAIWHLFVLGGTVFHFMAILRMVT
ncbi:hemolysin III [Cyclobacterium xiamenense]|uniref:Hemolysin III n=1 Tax=Cyclobacterium xiamenense TaxID=1297121 RepID=A0A1H6ZVK9_9BACT|nr:hemolysin III family protein [Cyclobacterium xiamenense]SEJ56686.1 hemolysin III [Cyclobacterium xiamenense]